MFCINSRYIFNDELLQNPLSLICHSLEITWFSSRMVIYWCYCRSSMYSSWSLGCSTTSIRSWTPSCTQSSQSASAEDSLTSLESAGFTRSHFSFWSTVDERNYSPHGRNLQKTIPALRSPDFFVKDFGLSWNVAEVCKSCLPSFKRGKQSGSGAGRVQPGEEHFLSQILFFTFFVILGNFVFYIFALARWSMWRGGQPTALEAELNISCPRSGERRS